MKHLNQFGVQNFRVFKDSKTLRFASITVLTGVNSSGKSSVIAGLKLLEENVKEIYKNDKIEFRDYRALLNSLLISPFDVHSLRKKYGNLEQLRTAGSDDDFIKFSIVAPMPFIAHEAIIEYTISVNNNKLRDGIVSCIKIITKDDEKVIVEIEQHLCNDKKVNKPEGDFGMQWTSGFNTYHSIKIDYCYFFNELVNRINKNEQYKNKLNSLTELLKCLNDGELEEDEALIQIQDLIKKIGGGFFIGTNEIGKYILGEDFEAGYPYFFIHGYKDKSKKLVDIERIGIFDLNENFVNEDGKEEFRLLINKFYKCGFKSANLFFTMDLLRFFSSIKWREPQMDTFDDRGIHFIFTETYQNHNSRSPKLGIALSFKGFINNYRRVLQGGDTEKDLFLGDAIKQNKEFYEGLLFPVLDLVFRNSKSNELILDLETLSNLQDDISLYSHKESDGESLMNEMIKEAILIPAKEIAKFSNFENLTAQRIVNQRSSNFSDLDEFSSLIFNLSKAEDLKSKNAFDFINKWIKCFNIGSEFIIQDDVETGSYKVYLKKGERKILLNDLGFGISQLLPIILKLIPDRYDDVNLSPWENGYKEKIISIEEPETNLHPALQSKLADMFVECAKLFNTQLIIETHSEYLIRRLQVLTADDDSILTPEDTQIYYFYHPDEVPLGELQVYPINIEADGTLTKNFGKGFFDEASNLNIALYNFTKSSKN